MSDSIGFDSDWDAGDMSCGDLVLELRLKLMDLESGQVLRVQATDPSAPEDIPAWCQLTGNSLATVDQPYYWIRKK